MAIGGAIATALAIFVEAPLARSIAEYQPAALWNGTLDVLEWLILLPAHKLALPLVLVGAMAAAMAVPRWRGYAPGLITIAFVHLFTRYTTNMIKDATGRFRPSEVLAKHLDGSFGYDGGVAFPSGHVVLFASLAIPILYVFPRTRVAAIPLLAIVAFVAVARIAVNAHWVSDTLGAITLVTFVTWATSVGMRPLPRDA